jgi:hypothetical protein
MAKQKTKSKRLDQYGDPDARRATFGPAGPAGEGSPVSSDSQHPLDIHDRGKSPSSGPAKPAVPAVEGHGKHPDPSQRSNAKLGPLSAAIPPERPAQGEGHC